MFKDKEKHQLTDGHVGCEGVNLFLEHGWLASLEASKRKSGLKRE